MCALKRYTFKRGIHPLREVHEGKPATSTKPIQDFVPETVCIPMDMHLGPPSKPLVRKGDTVLLGQVIGEAVGALGLPVHASVSGLVTDVSQRQMLGAGKSLCVTIKNDLKDTWVEMEGLGDVETAPADKIIPAVFKAGICGLGGACFPTHVKMTVPEGKSIDTVILNGAECECFLTSDHRLMLETPRRVVDGLRAVMRAMGVQRGIVGIEENKPDAIASIREAAQGRAGVEVAVLKTKYPQGGEKQIIEALLGREVPSGGLPSDVHAIVLNVGTAAAIADAITEGKPLISRVTTVTGCVKEPANLLIRIGTSFQDAIEACGGFSEEPGKVFAGGNMMGTCAPDVTVSITKANNGIVAFNRKDAALPDESPCIRCSRCIEACPIGLNPYRLRMLYDLGKLDEARKEHVLDCILCAACSYVCPAHRRLCVAFKNTKDLIAARRNSP